MNSKVIYLLFFLCSIQVYGQDDLYKTTWSDVYKIKGLTNSIEQSIIGHTTDYYFVLDYLKNQYTLLQYDYEHQLIKSSLLDFEYESNQIHFSKIINMNDSYYLMGKSYNRAKKKSSILALPISANGEPASEVMFIHSYDYVFGLSVNDKYNNKDVYGFKESKNSDLILFTFTNNSIDKNKAKEDYTAVLFDEHFKKIWEERIPFEHKDRDIKINDFFVFNSGEVLIDSYVKENKKKRKRSAKFERKIFKYSPKKSISEIKLTLTNEEKITSLGIYISKEDDFYVTGIKKIKKGKEHVLFLAKYNKKGENIFNKTRLLDPTKWLFIKKDFWEDGPFASKPKLSLGNFLVKKTLYNPDTETIITVFEYIQYLKKTQDAQGGAPIRNFIYNQLLVSANSAEGDFLWTTCIDKDLQYPKYRASELSFLLGYKNNKLYLIYNDEKKRNERLKSNVKKNANATFTDITCIDENGKIQDQRLLLNSKEINLFFNRTKSQFIPGIGMLIYVHDNKERKIGLLPFPD